MDLEQEQHPPERVHIPARFQDMSAPYLHGYRSARYRLGHRVNLDVMRYEPEEPLGEQELVAWTEGFRIGFQHRRAAGEAS
jgi:hypothetical protein